MQPIFSAIANRILTVRNCVALCVALCLQSSLSSALTSADFAAVPPALRATTQPLVMLTLSRDHQLFFKAYTDFDDLDPSANNGIESTYKNSFSYYGYFDSGKCYVYSSTNNRFEPVSLTANHYCNQGGATGQWSGNFLNWATMTRIDVLRKVLYGGYRRVDTATDTVLERSYLPYDAHSFAKYYNGSDAQYLTPYTFTASQIGQNDKTSGITLCNTTNATGATGDSTTLNTNTYPPVIRVVRGNYSLWAAGERYQCRYDDTIGSGQGDNGNDPDIASNPLKAYGVSPASSAQLNQQIVRVQVCKSTLIGTENCKKYPAGNYKPTGLLQQYGEGDRIRFGLTTGTYLKSKSGGVLRKNISAMTDEVNFATNGTFKAAPVTGGIINTLNLLRIVGYSYSDGTYNSTDSCSWGTSSFSNGSCTNWGNPFAETLLESYRYFAGASATSAFAQGSTNDKISGLIQVSWTDPLSSANACATLSDIAISSASTSFDLDELGGVTNLGTASTAAQLTNTIGGLEGITGTQKFVGRVTTGTTTTDGLCTAKTVSGLGNVAGVCPETPRLDGGYNEAGIANQARKADLRPSLSGVQKVDTFAVSLAAAIPQVTVKSPDGLKQVTIIPACRNTSVGGNCGLVDFKEVVAPTTTYPGGVATVTGAFYVNWEDTEWGGDFDQDGNGVLTYVLTNTGLTVTTDVIGQSTGDRMGFGYSLNGTGEDGFHAHSGLNNFGYTNASGVVECNNNCTTANAATSRSYTLSVSGGGNALLKPPLWYTAKYGNFNDINQNGNPDAGEWDVKDINGLTTAQGGGPDGDPDNYFPVKNPATLEASLNQVLQRISASVASSTAAAVVSNSGRAAGAIYQAVYYPQFQKKDSQGQVVDSVDWVGELQGFYIDDSGLVREDNGVKGTLEAMNIDYAIDIYYDAVQNLTLVQRYQAYPFISSNRAGSPGSPQQPVPFEQVSPIWSARNNLGALTNTQLMTQRSYNAATSTGRYIFTWIDQDKNGVVNNATGTTEVIPFVDTSFPLASSTPAPTAANQNNYRYLGLPSSALAAEVVNYVRGIDGTGRSRQVDYDSSGTRKTWRLGDIINSSPLFVGAPDANYDRQFGDVTYLAYKQAYENRRRVVYVGGNDGMLHAFNAGMWNSSTKQFNNMGQDLGGELWAYVPSNLLPHLQWLRESNYPHVFFVDGSLKSFDVNIFPHSTTHPNGWGTILVAGMRFGGGAFPLDTDGDATADTTTASAYVVFDITDPESPPVLLAELTAPTLGFTVGEPVVVKRRAPASGSFTNTPNNKWLLVVGSGPNVLSTATSTQNSAVFAWDITDASSIAPVTLNSSVVSGVLESNSFMGSMTSIDWNNDFADDAIYAGTVGGTVAAPTGKMKRVVMNATDWGLSISDTASANTLFDPARPVFAPPTTYVDNTTGNNWVLFGTGRYLVPQDSQSTAQQAYYGIKEPESSGVLTYSTVNSSGLVDVTDIQVSIGGLVKGAGGSTLNIAGQTITTFNELRRQIALGDGWMRLFSVPTGEAAERNYVASTLYFSAILFPTFQPDGDLCSSTGDGAIYGVSLFTGTAVPFAPLGSDPSTVLPGTTDPVAKASLPLGKNNPTEISIIPDGGNGPQWMASGEHGDFMHGRLGSPGTPKGRQSWREIEINFGL